MKLTYTKIAGLAGALVLPWFTLAASAAETYKLDPAHSRVGFAVAHMVINTVHGKFNEFSGTVSLEHNTVQSASGTIQVKSIDTGIARRDAHLQSPDFFD